MGKFKYAPWAFGLAALAAFGTNPVGVQAAPVASTHIEVSFGELDLQSKIIYTAAEEVASPFYKKGLASVADCVMIRKEPSVESEPVGKLYRDAGFEVLEDGAEWIRIRSGACEGYVSAAYVVTGKAAEKAAEAVDTVNSYAKAVAEIVEIRELPADGAAVIGTVQGEAVLDIVEVIPESEWTKVHADGIEGYVKDQTVEVGVNYNAAVSIEEETAELEAEETDEIRETEAAEADEESAAPGVSDETETAEETETSEEKAEAPETAETGNSLYIEAVDETVWATDAVNIRTEADSGSNKIGSLGRGSSIVRTGICDNGWSRVDYDGTTAYIHSDYLTTTEPAKSSGNASSESSGLGQQMIDFARQFIGNPYVYGGTSLTNGADCSGFVQSIYANFGYSIPRTCTTQFAYGRQISMDEIQPGDLLMYSYYGEIEHVALYTGEGTIVHASNEDTGIIETPMDYGGYPSHAIRILN